MNEICYLGTLTQVNNYGDVIRTVVYSDDYIFCKEKSVRYSEFYEAQAVGMKPELVFQVYLIDYNKEKYVKYEDKEYRVIRTYKTDKGKIELTLTSLANEGD